MEELDWYREELDGRKQCPSECDVTFLGGQRPRCRMEVDHALDHAGDGFYWTDEEAFKPGKWPKITLAKLYKTLAKIFFGGILLALALAFVSSIVLGMDRPPVWWSYLNYISAGGLIVVSILDMLRKKR